MVVGMLDLSAHTADRCSQHKRTDRCRVGTHLRQLGLCNESREGDGEHHGGSYPAQIDGPGSGIASASGHSLSLVGDLFDVQYTSWGENEGEYLRVGRPEDEVLYIKQSR